ncbi:hypothetical protein LX13_000654 [Williamsia maris]|uniref:DUF4237 domain-containing protein n=2 Tax=Williamsia maris TaxID=72806 RepID=A0ABT1H9B7_9NOCA|nr:hypothetical protein [Williamsia maris]
MSVPNRTGTERVFDIAPGQNGPFSGGDPRSTPRTIDPDANDAATGKLSGDLITPNPITKGGVQGPVPEERETESTYRGGSITKPGKGGSLEVGVGDRYQLRVVGAVPDGTRTVATPYGPETAVKYRYQYQSRRWVTPSLGGGALFNYVGKWEDASPDRVDQLVKRGVPLPGLK